MDVLAGGLGILGVVALLIFIFLSIILPISVYAAQKWAHKCFVQLKSTNELLAAIHRELEAQRMARGATADLEG